VFAATAAITIILSAVYTLNMIQKVFYGNTNSLTAEAKDIRLNEKMILGVIVIGIIVIGVYPKPILDITQGAVDSVLSRMITKQP
jgi:NADH-quinone oxidoreductase subunit M